MTLTAYDANRLAHRILLWNQADAPFVFVIGSGLSAPDAPSRRGVPGTDGVFDLVLAELERRSVAPTLLREIRDLKGALGSNRYQQLFGRLRGTLPPRDLQAFVHAFVLAAFDGAPDLKELRVLTPNDLEARLERMEWDNHRWTLPAGTEALGSLLARYPQRFSTDILTTNFDPLIPIAIRRAGGIANSFDIGRGASHEDFKGTGYRILHMHGFWRGQAQRHTSAELVALRPQLLAFVKNLVRTRPVVLLGYGGWDDVITTAIREVAAEVNHFEILWAFLEDSPAEVEEKYSRVITPLNDVLSGGYGSALYCGVNVHQWLPSLLERFETGGTGNPPDSISAHSLPAGALGATVQPSPFVIGRPLRPEELQYGREVHKSQIRRALNDRQPAEIVGERRMGKTSLIRWAEAEARPSGFKNVFGISMQSIAGARPNSLVDHVAQLLGKPRSAPTALAEAGPVLASLCPLVLLIDEAERLFSNATTEDDEFYEQCRALTQSGRLLWISASRRSLGGRLQGLGLTSRFLNDRAPVDIVGSLRQDEAMALAESGLRSTELAQYAVFHGGTAPYPLQLLCERLRQTPKEPEAALSSVEIDLASTFDVWLSECSPEERVALLASKHAVGSSNDSSSAWRPQALVVRGLMIRDAQCCTPNGEMWKRYLTQIAERTA